MNFYFFCCASFLLVGFVDADNAVSKPVPKTPVVSYTASRKVSEDRVAKMKLQIPTSVSDYKSDAEFTKKIMDDILTRVDLVLPDNPKNLPFPNLQRWQQYSQLAAREYFKELRKFDMDVFKRFTKDNSDFFGELYDSRFKMHYENPHGVLDEREKMIIQKVRTYMKLSIESFMGIPLDVDVVKYNLHEADESDTKNFPNKVKTMTIIKDEKKHGSAFLTCYINNEAMELKHLLRPGVEIKQFTKEMNISEKLGYTSKDGGTMWLCKDYSSHNMLKEPFVLFEYDVKFKSKEGKHGDFFWLQTYVDNKRVQFLDIHRLQFDIKAFVDLNVNDEKKKESDSDDK